jgi:hypothetical protein
MLKAIKACTPWLSWKVAGVAALVLVGIVLWMNPPVLGILAGATPLLLLAACLLPCLIPLAFLRRKR